MSTRKCILQTYLVFNQGVRRSQEISNTVPLSLGIHFFYNIENVFANFHLYFAMIGKAACKDCTFDIRKIGYEKLRQYANKMLEHS